MGSYPLDDNQILGVSQLDIHDDKLQKPNVYNKYLPFYELIHQQSLELFNEIQENLSRTIQLAELEPGLSFWSNKLEQFILLYGFCFTKSNHRKLIQFYLSILSIPDLNYSHVKTCFDMLYKLLRKTRLITRDDLIIDWHLFYKWAKLLYDNHDKKHGLTTLPDRLELSFILCVRCCSPYFSPIATREILDEFRPQICLSDMLSCVNTIKMLEIFLPVTLPPQMHHQGFKLWLDEFLDLWENIPNGALLDLYLINLFSSVAWNNIGYINWEPWLSKIFTHILRGFRLPIGEARTSSFQCTCIVSHTAKWIIAMLNNENSCLEYLKNLFLAMKSFYHPSNTGTFKEKLVDFLLQLTKYFLDRVHLERQTHPAWFITSTKSSRLSEETITDFVQCIKEYVFISIFDKNYGKEAAEACQYLSILRPELIIPTIVEKLFSSIDQITEPYRFTSIMSCLIRLTRQIVRATTSYPHGQTYVIPLLMVTLPGIDFNDWKKTMVTLDFYNAVFKLIICVDCSSAIEIRNDLTEIEKEVCLSTNKFEDFILRFLQRIFQMIEILSSDIFDDTESNIEDNTMESKMISIISSIVRQCSTQIFQTIREKIMDFISCAFLSPKVRKLVAGLVRALVKHKPDEILQCILPKTCDTIEKLSKSSDSVELLTDHKGDMELLWYLTLFSELLCARGDILFNYQQMIMTVFRQCISIINKNTYETIANAANHLLKSLVHVYPIDYRLTIENIDQSFGDFLPIRAWGEHVDMDQVQVQFHLPNTDEIHFAWEFVETFIYPELMLLTDKNVKLSNDQRLRSLTLIYYIASGCLNMVPLIDSKKVEEITIACDSKYRIQDSIYGNQLKFRENLRMRLLMDIGTFLDILISNHSDDVKSIKTALKIYSLSSIYNGVSREYTYKLNRDIQSSKKLFKNKLSGKRQHPRFVLIKKMASQLKRFELNTYRTLTDIDQQVLLKLFDLSLNQYSEVRCKAQVELFSILTYYPFSYKVIVDRIIELLNTEIDHDQMKGCLYILLGNFSFFLPTQHSWPMMEKLWPAIAMISPAKKTSTQNLINNINKKVLRTFVMTTLLPTTNEISKYAAAALWRPLKPNEISPRIEHNIQSYHNLMETLNSILKRDTLTWKQQKITMSLLCLLLQKQVSIPSSCIRTFVDFLIHDNNELRKYAEKGLAAICRLQKPPRIYVEKSREEIHRTIAHFSMTIDGYPPAKTQMEWEETCFLDKSFYGYYAWPERIKYPLNKRIRYTQHTMPEDVTVLYDRFIDENFLQRFIQLIIFEEDNNEIKFDQTRFAIFKGLFRNFGLVFVENFMKQLEVLIHEKSSDKQKGSHRIAAEIVAGMIRGSKYWTLEMLDELWKQLTPFLTEVCLNLDTETRSYWYSCFSCSIKNTDPRRMIRVIDFLRTLMNNQTISNTVHETSRWLILQTLRDFQWRIPSIWRDVNQQVKELLDHSSKSIRDCISSILSMSLSYDVTLFDGTLIHQPSVNDLMDEVCQLLRKAIDICDQSPLVNISGEELEMDLETCKALNYIESVIQMLNSYFFWSPQPIKDAIIRIFPYLCEIESIAANYRVFKDSLTTSRMNIGMNYLHTHFIEVIMEQLEEVSMSSKWHARRAAIDFVQKMVFSNLFNIRPYARQLHTFVLKCLFDEQLEVRMVASTTLAGFYQCGYIQVTVEDLEYFRRMSEINYLTKTDGKKVTLTKNIVKRHGGVLGLCAIVLSSPYDISMHVADALMLLCKYSYDPSLIQKSVQQCLAEFRRTHYDSWHEHEKNFTEEQLLILTDVFISHSYYA